MNPVVKETIQKFETPLQFIQFLKRKGIIESTAAAAKREGFKGLREYFKAARKES